ncbi:disease resistance protein RPM1-like [Coffea eugenioides]|uniref:disease resistance protein RPM1-like n=1 Tax=Coffea eugenioides TaxID=49369 RepID=UPI000F6048DB|nr:disease resistance protein RPM1-like [Coffea eugenioides]XP_027157217.1 disease resistance protein RPM1-like [Coffea eugenioides]
MAESVVGFLIKQLSTLLSQEITLLGGLKSDVQFINDELGSMKAFLREAEAKEDNNDSQLQEWLKQVREVAYDTEDVLDDFTFRFARGYMDGFCGKVGKIYNSMKNLKARHQISLEIKDIKARVGEISARHQRYQSLYGTQERGFISSRQVNADFDIRAQSLFIEEAQLVGIDKPKAELISKILDDHSQLKVVSVVGMGGLGKTTLVKKVYDDAAVKKQFQSHAWITVSQNFQFSVIIKNLIQQLYNEIRQPVPPQVESMDVLTLSEFVKDFLQERRYIIVLDDVWSIDAWEAIKCVLPDCNITSRVVLTTRIADVASASCLGSLDFIYKMKPLTDKESWTLFCNRTFQSNDCPPNLEEVAKKLLKKCEGLPLAIVAIGGVLALKDMEKTDEWEMILHGFGGEADGSGKLDRIKRVLLLSYNDLPYYLKSCLLYLSIYPEDYPIDVDDILLKWIALGFVEEKERITSTDIAMRYMKELINRSLIQVKSSFADGRLETCGLHDFLREIIVSKSKEQDFTTVATRYYTRWPTKVRHLAIHNFIDNPQEFSGLKCLRSVAIFGYEDPFTTTFLSEFLSGDPKLLKVLDLHGAELDNIPKQVFKLFHLRYLNLSGTGVKIIPKSIGKLQNLEVIDLIGTNVTELPADILNLRKLRCLCLGGVGDYSNEYAVWGCKSPDGIGKLVCLEDLFGIEADSDKIVREIGKLTQLRQLAITKLRREDGKELLSSLLRLTNLQKLVISCIKEDEILDLQHSVSPKLGFLTSLLLKGRLERVPQWVTSLQSLRILQLDNSRLREDENVTGSLGHLPNLVSLTLYRAYEGETLCFEVGGFQKLQHLELVQLTRLKWVRVEEESMATLRNLQLMGCKLMQELPSGIQNLTGLQFLGFFDMSDELMQKVQNLDQQSEDYQTISHIPQVFTGHWIDGHWEGTFL